MAEENEDICPELTDFYKNITKCDLLCDNILKQKRSQQRLIDDLHSTLRRISEKMVNDQQYVVLFLDHLKSHIKQLEDTVNILQDQLSNILEKCWVSNTLYEELHVTIQNLVTLFSNFSDTLFKLLLSYTREQMSLKHKYDEACQYYYGEGIKQSYKKAYQLFESLKDEYAIHAKDNEKNYYYAGCLFNKLGLIYLHGLDVQINYTKAEEYLKKGIDNYNNCECKYNMGILYEKKAYQSKDNKNKSKYYCIALEYYKMAMETPAYKHSIYTKQIEAKTNYATLIIRYQNLFSLPDGIDKTVYQYLKEAAQSEYPIAQNNFGVLLIQTEKRKRNKSEIDQSRLIKGIEYIKAAAEMNYDVALTNLGMCYEFGIDEKDYLKSEEYYKKSCDLGNHYGITSYGYMLLEKGLALGPKSLEGREYCLKAQNYFSLAAGVHDSEAIYYLGVIYEFGLTGDVNLNNSVNYYYYSHRLHHIKASYRLGLYYYYYHHFKQGVQLIEKAQECGYEEANHRMKLIKNDPDYKTLKEGDEDIKILDIENIGKIEYPEEPGNYIELLLYRDMPSIIRDEESTTSVKYDMILPIPIPLAMSDAMTYRDTFSKAQPYTYKSAFIKTLQRDELISTSYNRGQPKLKYYIDDY